MINWLMILWSLWFTKPKGVFVGKMPTWVGYKRMIRESSRLNGIRARNQRIQEKFFRAVGEEQQATKAFQSLHHSVWDAIFSLLELPSIDENGDRIVYSISYNGKVYKAGTQPAPKQAEPQEEQPTE